MPKETLDTRSYWEERLAAQTNLKGTGHRAFNLENNLWLYRTQRECLDQLLQAHQVEIPGKKVLDVGSGMGFFVDYYLSRHAGYVVGLDLTETSKHYLQEHYPDGIFYTADISEPELPFKDSFDIISAMGVLYHIVDEDRFRQALVNLCGMLNPGGFLLISDSFQKPLLPPARHARLRALQDYQPILQEYGVSMLALQPVYYISNQTFIPKVGPAVINGLKLGNFLYRLDNTIRRMKISNGSGLKTLLACKLT